VQPTERLTALQMLSQNHVPPNAVLFVRSILKVRSLRLVRQLNAKVAYSYSGCIRKEPFFGDVQWKID
jgi:hypothetical protein